MSTRRTEMSLVVLADLKPSSPASGTIRAAVSLSEIWGDGNADNKTNAGPYYATRTLGAASNEDIDLKALTDGEGTTIDFDEVAMLLVVNPSSNDGDLTIKPSAANGWPFLAGTTPAYAIPPGGKFYVDSPQAGEGVAVGASTDNINVANGGTGSVDYTILVIGRT